MYDIMKKTIRRLAVKVQGLGMQSSVQMVAKSTEALNELQQKMTVKHFQKKRKKRVEMIRKK